MTCAKDVHKYLPKEWPKKLVGDTLTKKPTNETNEAHPIDPKRKQMADPEDAGPTDSKKQVKRRRKLVKIPPSAKSSSSDDDRILSDRKGKK